MRAGPVPGRVDHQRPSGPFQECPSPVPGRVPPGRPGHLGGDVALLLAGGDRDHLAGPVDAPGGSHLLTALGRLPREPCTRPTLELRTPAGRLESSDPVLQRGPGGSCVNGGEDRQHECLRVPEHVAAIGRTGQPSRPDGRLSPPPGRSGEVEQAGPERPGGLDVARHLDVGDRPPPFPEGPLPVEQCGGAHLHRFPQIGEPPPRCSESRRPEPTNATIRSITTASVDPSTVRWVVAPATAIPPPSGVVLRSVVVPAIPSMAWSSMRLGDTSATRTWVPGRSRHANRTERKDRRPILASRVSNPSRRSSTRRPAGIPSTRGRATHVDAVINCSPTTSAGS